MKQLGVMAVKKIIIIIILMSVGVLRVRVLPQSLIERATTLSLSDYGYTLEFLGTNFLLLPPSSYS